MIVTFHIPVFVDAMIGKLTKPRHLIGTYPVEIDVPVLDPSDAPIVATFVANNENFIREEVVLRHFNGEFHERLDLAVEREISCKRWAEDHSKDLFSQPLRMITKRLVELELEGADTAKENVFPIENKHLLFDKHWRRSNHLYSITTYGLRGDTHVDGLQRFVDAFRSDIEGLCIVDGCFFRPCVEPVIRAQPFYGAVSLRVLRDVGKEPEELSEPASLGNKVNAYAYFRLPDFNIANSFPDGVGEYESAKLDDLELKIFNETVFQAPVEEYALVDLARAMGKRFCALVREDAESDSTRIAKVEEFLKSIDLASVQLYQQLNSAIEQYYADGDIAQVEDCVCTVLDVPSNHPFRHNFVGPEMGDQVDVVWEYWNSRGVSMALMSDHKSKI